MPFATPSAAIDAQDVYGTRPSNGLSFTRRGIDSLRRAVARQLERRTDAPRPQNCPREKPYAKMFLYIKKKNLVKIDCPPQKIGALLPSMKKNIGALPAFATAIIACVMLAISPVPLFLSP